MLGSRWTSWAPVPNSLYGLCRRKATSKKKRVCSELKSCVKVEVGRPGLPVRDRPYGLCGRNEHQTALIAGHLNAGVILVVTV